MEGDQLFVWDSETAPPEMADWITVLWRDFGESDSLTGISIPKLVEEHADLLKGRYLSWIYDLGELRFKGKRIVDHLELRPGFSFWWMTLLVEKCNYSKSPQITDAIRLLAFEHWISELTVKSVVLVSADIRLAQCMRLWFSNAGIRFEWQSIKGGASSKRSLKSLHRLLPHFLQALISLSRYLIDRWPLKGVGLKEWRETTGQVTFISYLFNLVPESVKKSCFESHYWAHLPVQLQKDGCQTNWLHLYVKDAVLPTSKIAAQIIRQFNISAQGSQVHVTLDTFLSAKLVLKVLRDGWRISRASGRLRKTLSSSQGAVLNLWPLFYDDWLHSVNGSTALINLLFFCLFESALHSLSRQQAGVYLQENQGWEFALVHLWQANGHGDLIGTPHSTVRYWDLRYFFDPRSYKRLEKNCLPLPEFVALNGAVALHAYRHGGYPEEHLVEVEALRYLHLSEAYIDRPCHSVAVEGFLRVLVLGDYLSSNTKRQLLLLEKAAKLLPPDTVFIVKPHPNFMIQQADYPGLCMKLTMDPVETLLGSCDVAFTGNVTSSAVDAYCAGLSVVSVLDPDSLNLSPLRGVDGVWFVVTHEELATALLDSVSVSPSGEAVNNYFILDFTLCRWRQLLQMMTNQREP